LLAPGWINISDENALWRFEVTYGVLKRLVYAEETVLRSFESVDGVDLEQAYEWVRGLVTEVVSTLNLMRSFS
jgi:hypothetical protein